MKNYLIYIKDKEGNLLKEDKIKTNYSKEKLSKFIYAGFHVYNGSKLTGGDLSFIYIIKDEPRILRLINRLESNGVSVKEIFEMFYRLEIVEDLEYNDIPDTAEDLFK